jgi:hypothetical protein
LGFGAGAAAPRAGAAPLRGGDIVVLPQPATKIPAAATTPVSRQRDERDDAVMIRD